MPTPPGTLWRQHFPWSFKRGHAVAWTGDRYLGLQIGRQAGCLGDVTADEWHSWERIPDFPTLHQHPFYYTRINSTIMKNLRNKANLKSPQSFPLNMTPNSHVNQASIPWGDPGWESHLPGCSSQGEPRQEYSLTNRLALAESCPGWNVSVKFMGFTQRCSRCSEEDELCGCVRPTSQLRTARLGMRAESKSYHPSQQVPISLAGWGMDHRWRDGTAEHATFAKVSL